MSTRNFFALLKTRWELGLFTCVGLDSSYDKIPISARKKTVEGTILTFNRAIIEATKDFACAYKLNPAFYREQGSVGESALTKTISYGIRYAPKVPFILDAKYGDPLHTNKKYAKEAFKICRADAVTVMPYFGKKSLSPFLKRSDKGIFVVCSSSGSGVEEFQDLLIDGEPLYATVAKHVSREWNENGNCAVTAGATNPDKIKVIRKIVGDMPILILGIGAQKGNLEESVKFGKNDRGNGIIINLSRSIIFASSESDFAEAARQKTIAVNTLIVKFLLEA